MPVITITMGETTRDEKARLIEELTAKASAITSIDPSHFTVCIHELSWDNLGLAGQPLARIRKQT